MSFNPPEGILDIGNATLRVGKLEVSETTGLNQGLQNIVKNDLLITETAEYSSNKHWGLKLPTTWVAEFEVKGETDKYVEFNFYNEGSTSNAYGYTLNFRNTALTLKFDNGVTPLATATIPTIVGTFRKVNIFLERGVIAVYIDGARVLYYKFGDGYNANLGVPERVISTTGSAFLNLFIEDNSDSELVAFKNLRIVNGRFISDKTSNVSFIGSLGVGVHSPKESLDIRGNMHFNRVSNVSQISVDSNVVTEYTGPHDRPLRKYPEVALTANDNSSTSGYVVDQTNTASHGNADAYAYRLFDSLTTGYQSAAVYSGGDSTGSAQTTTATDGSTHQGVAITLDLATKIRLSYAKITSHTYYGRTPVEGTFLGSNNNSTWDVIGTFSGLSTTAAGQTHTVHIADYATKSAYRYIRLVVTKIHTSAVQNGGTLLEFRELAFYGYEEGSGSLDTTLKTVYNVPATTGTQLEVYYDAKDLAEMPGTVTDLSPNTNTGALSTSRPTLDSTNGIDSFKFDASLSQNITSTIDTSYWGTNKLHSVAFWFKADRIDGKYNIFHIGNPSNNESSGFWISDGQADNNAENSLNWWFYNADSTTKVSTFSWTLNTWYHIALTFDGSAKKMYVNGHHIDFSVGNVTAAPTGIPNSASLAVGSTTYSGDYFDGSIANFRVYGAKVLNANQVKELYDYQKDYFLGSKSQVTLYKGHLGVGVTEPSGQLELAGDERIQEYPPRAFETSAGSNGPDDLYIEGHGHFKAWSTSYYNTDYTAGGAFTKSNSHTYDSWISAAGDWELGTTSTGLPTASAPTFAGYKGGHLILELPYSILLKSFIVDERQNLTRQLPSVFVIIASNDGINWDTIFNHTATAGIESDYAGNIFSVNATKTYSQYGFVALKNGNTNSNDHLAVGEWRLFGTPGSTILDKGSLSLTRSLDVPRVSRYDVDTETPRPEKLVVDFDTTVGPVACDISGNKNARGLNDGRFEGSVYYDASRKAFTGFTDDSAGHHIFVPRVRRFSTNTDTDLSVSVWVKVEQGTSGSWRAIWEMGVRAAGQHVSMYIPSTSATAAEGPSQFNWNMWGTHCPTGETVEANRWYHVVGTYDKDTKTKRIYVDGVFKKSQVISTGMFANLSSEDPPLIIGTNLDPSKNEGWDGDLSNFKMYNCTLTSEEVKKLYNLGRIGRTMVISDTAVGIGKAPQAQLDVRGTGRFTHGEATGTFAAESLVCGINENLTNPRDFSGLRQFKAARGGSPAVEFRVNVVNSWVPGIIKMYGASVDSNSSNWSGYYAVIIYRRYSFGDSGAGDIDISTTGMTASSTPQVDGTGTAFEIEYDRGNGLTDTGTSDGEDIIRVIYRGGGARDILSAECTEYSRLFY